MSNWRAWDPGVRTLAVGLIRAMNSADVRPTDTDDDLLFRYGDAAQPLAEALCQVVRDEVARASAKRP